MVSLLRWGQYLRVESLYDVATLVNTEYRGGRVSLPDLHAQFHGESFLSFLRYVPDLGNPSKVEAWG